jgi:hypothetical protein
MTSKNKQDPAVSGAWKNRIVGQGEVQPDQLLANPKNWRIHPKAQQDALTSVLDRVGWVQQVIVNKETNFVVDGHLRVSVAISRDEPVVPVVYVELNEEEEALILAMMDPLAALAITDEDQLRGLVEGLDIDAEVHSLLSQVRLPVSIDDIDVPDADSKGTYEGGQHYSYRCPECAHEWSGAQKPPLKSKAAE